MHDTMPDTGGDRTSGQLRSLATDAMDDAWVDLGYTAPNRDVYPWMWLWDSCFHAIIWAELGVADRARTEIESVLSLQDPTGFVPHMGYGLEPGRAVEIWGRVGSSSITQPPMYGHTLAELARRGVDFDEGLLDRAALGLRFLFEVRDRCSDGLISVVHPWETGCDDSPRWDDFCPGDGFDAAIWRSHKMDLLGSIKRGRRGEPLANPAFAVAPIGFNSLVAWNALELVKLGRTELAAPAAELIDAVDARWDSDRLTWADGGLAHTESGRVRTVDALLALLVTRDPQRRVEVARSLIDPPAHGSRHGPLGVHRDEPSFAADAYWRGPVWPQITYLLWLALSRSGSSIESVVAEELVRSMVSGATTSGLSEYWNGDSGRGLGAVPQCWSGLVVAMAPK